MQVVRGFCMGAADIVPGVSGGTIALVLGIYHRLVDNVHTGATALGRLVKIDLHGAMERLRAIEWMFLLPLLAGIGAALLALSQLIEDLLHDHPEEMAGLFLGLVAASVIIAIRMIRHWSAEICALGAAVALVTFAVLGLQGGSVVDPAPWQFVGAGALAICAMILPGISGSFLLLMLGMYAPVLGAINERDLVQILVFAGGAVVGLALFSTLLSWLLRRFADAVLAALTGLMVGSIRVLWPWPNGVGVISDDEDELISGTGLGWADTTSDFLWPTLLAIGAFVLVLGLSTYAERRIGRDPARADTVAV